MSAIPWIGQDIVEFIWGGLIEEPNSSYGVQQILFDAGISSKVLGYVLISKKNVKKPKSRGQSAEVRKCSTFEASQRLNTEDIYYSYLVGLYDGCGSFVLKKTGIYFHCEISLKLDIKDTQLIYKIKEKLGIGVVTFNESNGIHTANFIVRKSRHIDSLVPIFVAFPLLSNKHGDFIKMKFTLLDYKKLYEDIDDFSYLGEDPKTVKNITNSAYLPFWLVGYIESKGSFSIYKSDKNKDVASFEISHPNDKVLIQGIRKYLFLRPRVYRDEKTNDFTVKVTSPRSIGNVIKFLQKAPVKLLGHKKLEFILWIKKLRTIPKYDDWIYMPEQY